MKTSLVLVLFVSACSGSTAFAQVASDASSSAQRDAQSSPSSRPPTYTPEQLFGPPRPQPASTEPRNDPSTVPQQLPNTANSGSGPDVSGNALPQPGRTPSCPTQSPPSATPHPGVSASQFKRAGVSAEAFTRPGVSAEDLNALRP